jgi:thiamine-monophosphate kinase
LSTATWREVGWKALAVNLSDIAAMGGKPQYALVSLALPGDTEVADMTELYQGMAEIAHLFEVAIAGGNVASAPVVIMSLMVLGSTAGNILTRSAAAPGDCIAVTGYLGSSAAGLTMLKKGLHLDEEASIYLRQAHLKPYPRIIEVQLLAQHGIRAAMDISDGLLADLSKVCQASKVGARIYADRLPVHPLMRRSFDASCLSLALSGGEDYELLLTGKAEVVEDVRKVLPCPLSVIGEIVRGEPGQVTTFDEQGKEIRLGQGGWDHFKEPA